MRLWRIASERYDSLDGEGARLAGGRWNSPGRAVVYLSAHASLAVLEKLVWTDPDDVPDDLVLFEIDAPDGMSCIRVETPMLLDSWTEPGCAECVELGDDWLRSASTALLGIPSAVVPEEENVLLNSAHEEAPLVRVIGRRPFRFDLRLLS